MPTPPALDPEHTLADQRRDLLLDQILLPVVEARRSVAPSSNVPVSPGRLAFGTRDSLTRRDAI